ncbi:MAG: nitrite reductase/ring-hydroxylating ferredoxin subunit [Lentisphaeria bacterium]|jgi:nitrite reductase/ring-hydroxylating ferredoxin subunit
MPFHPLEKLSRLHDGYQRAFKIEGHALLLCQMEGQVFIIENNCPHMDAPLTDATQVSGGKLRCRAHGIEFDLNSGRACGPLADTIAKVSKFSVVYEGGSVGTEF